MDINLVREGCQSIFYFCQRLASRISTKFMANLFRLVAVDDPSVFTLSMVWKIQNHPQDTVGILFIADQG
jgi:hypothetical protein